MLKMVDSLKDIVKDSDYIILKNGEIVESSGTSLNISESMNLKVIHFIDKDTNINLVIDKDIVVPLEEIFYEIKSDVLISILLVRKIVN